MLFFRRTQPQEHVIKFTNIEDLRKEDPEDPRIKEFEEIIEEWRPIIELNIRAWIKSNE